MSYCLFKKNAPQEVDNMKNTLFLNHMEPKPKCKGQRLLTYAAGVSKTCHLLRRVYITCRH